MVLNGIILPQVTCLHCLQTLSYEEQEVCLIYKKTFCMDEHDENYKNKKKVKDHCHYTENLERLLIVIAI